MKKNEIKIMIVLLVSCIFIFTEYKLSNSSENNNKEKVRIAIIFNEVGLGDKSFNDLCYEGMLRAQEELGIEFDYTQVKNYNGYKDIYIEYANTNKYDLIIGLGGEQERAVKEVSKKYPKQKFTLLDSKLKLPNVSSIYTNWNEQTFLNGVISALCISKNIDTNENKVGIILGKDLSYLREGAIGFEAGVKYINPKLEVIKAVVGDFSDPAKAKEIALLMYNKGVSYIQQIAGKSGFGVFAAAKESEKYVFGVDANQNSYEPDYIVSTATRYADNIIYDEINLILNKTWESGVKELGLDDGVIGYETEGSNVVIDSQIIKKVEEIKEGIIDKKIKIPLSYKELDRLNY